MNRNKYNAKMFNPKRHSKHVMSEAKKLWILNGLIVGSLLAFNALGWV